MKPPANSPVLPRGTMPPLELLTDSSAISTTDVDVLVIPSFSGESGVELAIGAGALSHAPSPFDGATQVAIWKSLVATGASGRAGETCPLPAVPGINAGRLLAVGLGDADALTDEGLRTAAGEASRALADLTRAAGEPGLTALSLLGTLGVGPATEGHGLGSYEYTGVRDRSGVTGSLRRLLIATPPGPSAAGAAHTDFARACVIIEAVSCARDLVNAPANVLYPSSYADHIADLATQAGLQVEILDEDELAEQGFGAILGVGQGSPRPPRLVQVSYHPDADGTAGGGTGPVPHVALVGKGVTFDTGGISLKPSPRMDNMISDMGGSAAVVAAVLAASELDLPVAVTATVPLAENMPDGTAVRPGDVLRHYGGTTTEVLNTDAEGRLILGDAIARACEDDPDYLVDTATLTGAQVRSLGDRTPAVMGTPAFRDRVTSLSRAVGEGAWSMPLPAEIAADIRSDVADLRNIPKKSWGGMAAAGHYLAAFVPDGLPWVHLDVAGPAYNTAAPHGYTPRRATGVPVRTIIAVLENIAADTAEATS